MRIDSITLEKFRSYPTREISFGDELVHVLIGPNGIGKTNILEAISLLSLTKSCQKADETDLIAWGE
ncbi:MAG: AAA family ATPase, partial [Candidatus Peribacteraceae bacterium]|nr:AAA family ATPase [Candidatus Peribacteraceae bacterium]